jgi:hypothetical protein
MTEQDWLTATDPDRLLGHLYGRGSPRRWRLFACACARHVAHLLSDPQLLHALEVAERLADGRAGEIERRMTNTEVDRVLENGPCGDAAYSAGWAIVEALEGDPVIVRRWSGQINHAADAAARNAEGEGRDPVAASAAECTYQCAVLRDLFGNPIRIVRFDPGWRTWNDGTIVRIARRIDQEQAFVDLPILADALEEAGCTEAEVLDHCRQPGVHVRGCWVLDWLLGRFRGDILFDKSLEAAVGEFLFAFENVFHHDWDYARGMMGEPFISAEGTFLVPRVADEDNDWGTRAALLRRYRVLRRVMEEKGIAPPPLGEPGVLRSPESEAGE